MLCTIPDYYKEFSCIAADCEDTCCAGWQIVIDEKSKRRYAKAATGLQPARLEPCCYQYIYSIIASLRFLQLPEYNGSVRRCRTMKEQKYHIYLTEQERSEVIKSLIDLKNTLIRQGKYTDAVDDVLVKLTGAKRKKLKVVYI